MMSMFSFHRNSRSVAFILVVGLFAVAPAQVEVWTTRYDAGYDRIDEAAAMVLTRTGDPVLTGKSWVAAGSDTSLDIATLRVRGSDGEIVWVRRWQAGVKSFEVATAVATDTFENVFVCGRVRSTGTDTDYVTLKYDPSGSLVWSRRYTLGNSDGAVAVCVDNQGGCFVTGSAGSAANHDIVTVRYSADGTELWTARYSGPANGQDIATAMVLDAAGYPCVTGYSWMGSTRRLDYLTIRYNPATGETLWTRTYDGTEPLGPKDDYAFGITTDLQGNIYVTGKAVENGTYYDVTTIKYLPTGEPVWVNRFDWGENGYEGASAIEVGPNQQVYVGGFTEIGLSMYDMLLFALNENGDLQWQRSYNYVNEDDSVTAIHVDRYGSVYVVACSYSIEYDLDWVVAKYTAAGNLVWLVRHSAFDEDDVPTGVESDALGNIFVGGYDCIDGSTDYAVTKFTEYDVGASLIISPTDTLRLDAVVTPRVLVRNYSALELTFPVRLEIGNFYFDQQNVAGLAPYDSAVISFAGWLVRDTGTHTVRCYSMLTGDKEPGNDTVMGVCTGIYVWELLPPVPPGPKNKAVKDGGALAFARDSLVFAFKGYNTCEFYRYNVHRRFWTTVESIPRGPARKRVKAGAQLEADTSGRIYAFKGNNTLEFYRYNIQADSWRQLRDYPIGSTGRKIKGGSGLVYVPRKNWLFGLKGANSTDFYAYDVVRDSWFVRSQRFLGPDGRRAKDGSCLCYDGDSTIYMLKGGTYEFWAYRIEQDTWVQKKSIRDSDINPRRRKTKKGAALAFDPVFRRVYATKGAKQTEFWYFDVVRDTWVETRDT
ncbi:MAG: SBBP repeat-containing protein, partial [candidate division WOR-3 bacterium]